MHSTSSPRLAIQRRRAFDSAAKTGLTSEENMDREPSEVTNLDRYGNAALPWSRARDILVATPVTAGYHVYPRHVPARWAAPRRLSGRFLA